MNISATLASAQFPSERAEVPSSLFSRLYEYSLISSIRVLGHLKAELPTLARNSDALCNKRLNPKVMPAHFAYDVFKYQARNILVAPNCGWKRRLTRCVFEIASAAMLD